MSEKQIETEGPTTIGMKAEKIEQWKVSELTLEEELKGHIDFESRVLCDQIDALNEEVKKKQRRVRWLQHLTNLTLTQEDISFERTDERTEENPGFVVKITFTPKGFENVLTIPYQPEATPLAPPTGAQEEENAQDEERSEAT